MRIFFGKDKSIELNVPSQCLVLSNETGRSVDPENIVNAALASPLGLPALEQCIMPEDKIVLAVGADVPCEVRVIACLASKLIACGILPENITVLLWESDASRPDASVGGEENSDSRQDKEQSRERTMEKALPDGVVVHRHRTSDPQSYEILATMDSGEPLAFVRPIVDADVVIPVGVYEPTVADQATSMERLGIFSALYPRFSPKEDRERFNNPVLFNLRENELPDLPDAVLENLTESNADPREEYADLEDMSRMRWEKISGVPDQRPRKKDEPERSAQDILENQSPELYRSQRKAEAQKSGWALGIVLTTIVVPGVGDSINDVFFGLPREVEGKIERLKMDLQTRSVQTKGIGKLRFQARPPKVICCLNGADATQTWSRLADLVESASFLSADHSVLYLCAEITQNIGPGFQLIMEASDLLAGDLAPVSAKLYREKFPDSIPALRWLRVLQSHRIYWLSNLPPETVESLGAVPVNSEELINLVERLSD